MRSFRTNLQKAVKLNGGEIRDEQERRDGSSLVGFRFVYVEGKHTGTVDVTYGSKKPFGTFPDVDPPFCTLYIRMKESTGFGEALQLPSR